MQFVKKNFLSLVVLVLLVVILLQRCSGPVAPEAPKVVRDTTWIVKDSLIVSKPQLIKSIAIESHDTIINQYLPDTNYAKLVLQYQEVVNQLLTKNILADSIRIDTSGYVKITDTVQKNLIVGRGTQVNIKYPIIKETVTIPPKKVTQLYVGGGVDGKQTSLINQIRAGVILKSKNDKIFTASAGLNIDGQPVFGLGSYWKIKLKK